MKHITSLHGIDRLVESYQQYLREVRGLAPGTCAGYRFHVQGFLTEQRKRVGGDLVLSRLRGAEIMKFLTRQRIRYRPVGLQYLASALRSFLRFLALRGQCAAELVQAVPRVQAGPRMGLPSALSEAQLQTLLASLTPQTLAGARARAVVLCLAKLGLRAGEVARLALDDLDWRQGTLRLTQTKGRRERLLPVAPVVGQALAHYLQFDRSATRHRRVFVALKGGQPLTSAQVSQLTVAALQRAHLFFPSAGAQLLRRTFATHLAQKGSSVKEIADLLGHRSLNTARFYIQSNLSLLQTVAQPWPEVMP